MNKLSKAINQNKMEDLIKKLFDFKKIPAKLIFVIWLIGQHYINPKGSFSLITGALTHDPQKNFANASAANGAVEAFV